MADTTLAAPIVLDNGSGLLKAGYAGSDLPDIVLRNFVGRPKHERVMTGVSEDEIFFGRKAEELKGILRLSHPITHGVSDLNFNSSGLYTLSYKAYIHCLTC